VRRELPGGYELDDDVGRTDLDAVWVFLSTEAYWGRERAREMVERQIREATRVIGLFHDGRQVGFARYWSDGRVAYLADVYVLAEHRGRGLGVELVRFAVEEGPHADLRWMLHTRDGHELYERFGFGPPDERYLERPPAAERD
jgi:GNAT superfamily N-acetyltransferase